MKIRKAIILWIARVLRVNVNSLVIPVIAKTTISFLRKREWKMGNGQCDDCLGNEPGAWAPHPCVPTKEHEGHELDCPVAMSLEELGATVIYKRV